VRICIWQQKINYKNIGCHTKQNLAIVENEGFCEPTREE
jgi:hypothetical protein